MIKNGRVMKISSARFAGSSTIVSQKPEMRLPEFAFIGRSNVGKSSLINALALSRLAKTAAAPGKTRLVNHFLINESWYLVDLPGYGYAKASDSERRSIEAVIRNYLNFSEELRMLMILVDCRHPVGKVDMDFIREVAGSTIPFALVYTKADKMGPVAVARQVDGMNAQILAAIPSLKALPPFFITSSQTKKGRDELLDFIGQTLAGENPNKL